MTDWAVCTQGTKHTHLSRMIFRQVSEASTKSLRLSFVTMTPSVFSAKWSRNLMMKERGREEED